LDFSVLAAHKIVSVAWEMRAASARYAGGHWTLEKGTRVEYDDAGGLPSNSDGTAFDVLECPEITESPREIFGSMRPTEELTIREMFQLLSTREDLARSSQNIYWTQIWFRLSAPFSCLGAALVGIALSLGAHRGSRMLGFGIALCVLVLYYFAGRLFVILGQYGYLPAVVAGVLPTFLLAAWGVWEMRRRN
jgi:lipopolysaccharide export LptBFGC system permease protein LptF